MQSASKCCICLAVVIAAHVCLATGKHAHGGVTRKLLQNLAGPEDTTKVKLPSGHTAELPTVDFKLPKYNHADSLSAATDGFLDWFLVIYWGSWILFVVAVEAVIFSRGGASMTAVVKEVNLSRESSQVFRRSSLIRHVSQSPEDLERSLERKLSIGSSDEGPRCELNMNLWTLNLLAAQGNAWSGRRNTENQLRPMLVFIGAIAMGLTQLFTLFLIVYDIDPAASPYTEKPSAPWKTSAVTVNCMKFVMVFFLGMAVVDEAGDAYDNYINGMGVDREKLKIPRFVVLFIPLFHYVITLFVILTGVSVILSCQAVPDILYNSMAILFITQVDEYFWGFCSRAFDIDAEWSVELGVVPQVKLLKKCIIMFPMLWGFCLMGRAWYRDQMPALIVRVVAKQV